MQPYALFYECMTTFRILPYAGPLSKQYCFSELMCVILMQCYLTGMTLHLYISEGEKRMETLGGPKLHRSPMVPSVYALLRGNGELLIHNFR